MLMQSRNTASPKTQQKPFIFQFFLTLERLRYHQHTEVGSCLLSGIFSMFVTSEFVLVLYPPSPCPLFSHKQEQMAFYLSLWL